MTLKDDCWDCGGSGRFCPSEPDKCNGCENCERCGGSGADPGTPHAVLIGSVADPKRRKEKAAVSAAAANPKGERT